MPAEIPAVHFAEALRIAGGAGPDEPDLAPAHERALGEWALREHGSDFVFVTGYPMAKRPFYTHPDPLRPAYSNGFDLLFRGVELVTGGQRLHRYDDYVAALAARGESIEPYESYVDAFRHGMPPHGGFAIGLERFVARLVGAANVREVTAFPARPAPPDAVALRFVCARFARDGFRALGRRPRAGPVGLLRAAPPVRPPRAWTRPDCAPAGAFSAGA